MLAALALFAGCQAEKPQYGIPVNARKPVEAASEKSAPLIGNTDPSATNLHNIEGAVLMYYFLNKKLPAGLEQVVPLADEPISLTVPGTNKPYLYTPDGFLLQDKETRIIVFEPEPTHRGHRLCITMTEPQQYRPPQCNLIAMPESFFLLRPPVPTAATPTPAAAPPLDPPPPPKAAGRPQPGSGNRP